MLADSIILFVLINLAIKTHQHPANVCRNFHDYFKMENNPNCWYERDVSSDVPDVIKNHGYPLNTYTVVTGDGYILTIFRMPRAQPRGVVVLEPPMTGTSANFLKSGNGSLAFALWDAGYDVWLPNSRGTYYSRKHVQLQESDARFWDFSFHELGVYDFPAAFDLVKNVTKRGDATVIGYSMAGTALLVYASMLPQHAYEHVKAFIAIAPAVYYISPVHLDQPFEAIKGLRTPTVFDSFEMGRAQTRYACNSNAAFLFLCMLGVTATVGRSMKNFDPSFGPLIFENAPTRVSEKLLQHFGQVSAANRFQQFDYGKIKNLMVYGNLTPPLYPLERITVPIYTIVGDEDKMSSVKSAERIYAELSTTGRKHGIHLIKTYNHVDYFWALTSKSEVVDHIVQFLGGIY